MRTNSDSNILKITVEKYFAGVFKERVKLISRIRLPNLMYDYFKLQYGILSMFLEWLITR